MSKRKDYSTPKNLRRVPKPRNDAELAALTAWYFGVPLSLRRLDVRDSYASYEVEQDYSAYQGNGFQFGKGCLRGYDNSAAFWRFVIGRLTCGGIARASYGQTSVSGWRNQRRLLAWTKSRRAKDGSPVRRAFVRLALAVGEGENRTIRGSSVLTVGREDGAAGASFNSEAST